MMTASVISEIDGMLERAGGKTAVYAKDLRTGELFERNAGETFLAASVIKVPVLVECFAQMREGRLSKGRMFTVRPEDKVPPCGVLTLMHDGLAVTLEDLYTLMITVSDNTATNMLIDTVGICAVNARMRSLGLTGTVLRRRLFDAAASAAGIENTIVPREIGLLLEGMYRGAVVGAGASAEMVRILSGQQLNGKMPVLLPDGVFCAHKTGEDDGITHDAGILYGKTDMVCVLCANGVDTGPFDRDIQRIALLLYSAFTGNGN